MSGILYGVGAGCGDPSEITLKAIEIIKQCAVIIFPAGSKDQCRAYDIVKDYIPENKELHFFDFPMIRDKSTLNQRREKIYESVKEYLSSGKDTAFVTIGDPLIYSTFSYIAAFAYADGFTVRYADGIPSFLSCASLLGIILGDGNEQIHIIPGSADLREALELPGIKIFMKLGKHISELKEILDASDHEFLGAVSHCGMPDEEIYKEISIIPNEKAYLLTAFVR